MAPPSPTAKLGLYGKGTYDVMKARGDAKKALQLHQKFYPVFKDLFIESNPVPVKAALAMMGQMEEECRLPLAPMAAKNRETLRATLKSCGVLK